MYDMRSKDLRIEQLKAEMVDLLDQIAALEVAQQPAPVNPDKPSDVMLDAVPMRECKVIPVKDYEAALELLRKARRDTWDADVWHCLTEAVLLLNGKSS
jgi:t-SNARE complex subunit (syntaxin)